MLLLGTRKEWKGKECEKRREGSAASSGQVFFIRRGPIELGLRVFKPPCKIAVEYWMTVTLKLYLHTLWSFLSTSRCNPAGLYPKEIWISAFVEMFGNPWQQQPDTQQYSQ